MIFTWLIGVQGVTTGCTNVLYLRDGNMPDDAAPLEVARQSPEDPEKVMEYVSAVRLRALAEHRDRTLPLGVARGLLSLLLVMASAMVLSGRPGARSLALQALGANALFSVANYVLTQDMRDQWIGALANANLGVARPELGWVDPRAPQFWYWMSRMELAVFELGVPAVASITLVSKRTRAFLEAAHRAEQGREREDEP